METDTLKSTPAIAISLTGITGTLIIGALTLLMYFEAALEYRHETSVPSLVTMLWEYTLWGVLPALILCALVWVMKRRWLGFALAAHLLLLCGACLIATVSYIGSLHTGTLIADLLFYGTLALAVSCAISVAKLSQL